MKPRHLLIFAVIVAALALGTAVAHAQPDSPAAAAVQPDRAESAPVRQGYWFYQKKDEDKPQETEPQPVQALGPPPAEDQLLKMHPTQVSKLIEDYRQYALYTMQPEQVRWYFQLQDFARRRSRAFMNVTELVMLENPALNMNVEYPVNAPGNNARVLQREQTIGSRLQRERDGAALVMLSQEGCGFCEAQRGVLKYFEQKHGWEIKEVDIHQRPDIATRFATTTTPTTFILFKSGEWAPIAVGVESLPRLEENAYREIRRLHGETSPEQFTTLEYEDGGLLDPSRR